MWYPSRRHLAKWAGFLMLCIAPGLPALAADAKTSAVTAGAAQVVLERLRAARPDLEYGAIKPSPVTGLYQVQVADGPLLYVSEDGAFALAGKLYGVAPGGFVDLEELAMQPLRKARLEAIPASDEIIFPAEGRRKASIFVFTDVDCSYCRKLHREVPELNAMGIEVRYLAYPRAGIGSESHRKIAAAWCADDRQGTMTRLKNLQKVDVAYCEDNPVAEQYRLGNELGVRGTPAIILEDGSMLPGYLPAKVLAQRVGI